MKRLRLHALTCAGLVFLAWRPAGAAGGEESIPAGPGGQLYFHDINGSMEVVSGGRDEVVVRMLGEAARRQPPPQLRLTREGSRVKATVSPAGVPARFQVRVPARFNLDLQLHSGGLTVSNLQGNVRVRSASGPVNLGDVRGDVDAEGAAGPIAVRRATGSLRLRTAGGSLWVGEAGGVASLETAGGGIRVLVARALVRARTAGGGIQVGAAWAAVDARSAGGSIAVNFIGQPREDCVLQTEGGSVEARVARGLGLEVACENPATRIAIRLGDGWQEKPLAAAGRRREGKLRAGGVPLRLRSSGAGVWLEDLAETRLPDVDREFALFRAGQPPAVVQAPRVAPPDRVAAAQVAGPAPRKPAREERVRPRDEFAVTPESGPTVEAGLILPDGTPVPAEILSADDTQVIFRRAGSVGEAETWPVSRVAVLLFQPVPHARLGLLQRPATGLVLRNGDFLEGDFQSLQKRQVHLASVVFGLRRVRLETSVIALALRPFRALPLAGPAAAPAGDAPVASPQRP